jgi:hypothetical protein
VPRHIAFLRAINVGGRIVKMDRLRALFSDMGFTGVETFIASGNVIFESRAGAAALEKRIQQQLERALGYAVVTFVRSPAEVARVARLEPFSKADLGAPGHRKGIHRARGACERGECLCDRRAGGVLAVPDQVGRVEFLRRRARTRARHAGDPSERDHGA